MSSPCYRPSRSQDEVNMHTGQIKGQEPKDPNTSENLVYNQGLTPTPHN